MKNKVLVELVVPTIDKSYEIYLPICRKIGSVIALLKKALMELNPQILKDEKEVFLYNALTGERYNTDEIIKNTDIRNGTRLILK